MDLNLGQSLFSREPFLICDGNIIQHTHGINTSQVSFTIGQGLLQYLPTGQSLLLSSSSSDRRVKWNRPVRVYAYSSEVFQWRLL